MCDEITPTRARQWRTEARLARANYLDAVATFRSAMAARRAAERTHQSALGRAHIAAEDAAGRVWEARLWHRQTRARVRKIDSGAVTVRAGAAWSDRGLANVRAANARR